jgi:hypothetical protein
MLWLVSVALNFKRKEQSMLCLRGMRLTCRNVLSGALLQLIVIVTHGHVANCLLWE